MERAISVSPNAFSESVKEIAFIVSEYELPSYMNHKEEDIPKVQVFRRDNRYQFISDLISPLDFLLDITTNTRGKLIASPATKHSTYVQNIYRALNMYWKCGQKTDVLL
ncbi:hypothetical protein N478_17235 [Pseudoalteromonas luteoviolacea S4060-1]|uniref:Uncharacterized protein n=1 Tax=Pseudoalteromonas luteoviolacea S4060-1 TaxID=1365257 RepID=A0A162CHG0_9GAMM|nr:hypothetical protein N478_17235 [Pseudoalteromonas luteoviolacea S4060-1]